MGFGFAKIEVILKKAGLPPREPKFYFHENLNFSGKAGR